MSTKTLLRHRLVRLAEPLLTPHGVDRYLETVAPVAAVHEIRARVTATRHQTSDTVTLTLRPNRRWTGFDAGQFTQLTVEIDGVRHTRCYSMANAATDDSTIELTIKAHPDGLVSNHLVDHGAPGLIVGLTPADGNFVLPETRPERVLLISGGSGITPVMSMLRTLMAEGHSGPITFVHYALTTDTTLYATELDRLERAHANLRVVRVFTAEPGTGDADGLFSPDQLDSIEPDWARAETFVCGPAPLMDAMTTHYGAAGRHGQLHQEAFTVPVFVAEAGRVGGTLRFTGQKVAIANDGRSILDQAEDAGLKPESGCRMGICHTCTRPLRSGTVRNLRTGTLASEIGAEVQICSNVAVGDVEIEL